MAKVLHLFRAPKKRAPMEELATAHVVENVGLEGCAHARPNGKSFPFNQALRPFVSLASKLRASRMTIFLSPRAQSRVTVPRPGG
jgi:hypothetical protein